MDYSEYRKKARRIIGARAYDEFKWYYAPIFAGAHSRGEDDKLGEKLAPRKKLAILDIKKSGDEDECRDPGVIFIEDLLFTYAPPGIFEQSVPIYRLDEFRPVIKITPGQFGGSMAEIFGGKYYSRKKWIFMKIYALAYARCEFLLLESLMHKLSRLKDFKEKKEMMNSFYNRLKFGRAGDDYR